MISALSNIRWGWRNEFGYLSKQITTLDADKDTKLAEGDFGDDNPFVMIIKNTNNNVDVFANGGASQVLIRLL